jgi:hypothetical protein
LRLASSLHYHSFFPTSISYSCLMHLLFHCLFSFYSIHSYHL